MWKTITTLLNLQNCEKSKAKIDFVLVHSSCVVVFSQCGRSWWIKWDEGYSWLWDFGFHLVTQSNHVGHICTRTEYQALHWDLACTINLHNFCCLGVIDFRTHATLNLTLQKNDTFLTVCYHSVKKEMKALIID